MATYIHPCLVIRLRLSTTPLARPIPVFNVDDTPNKKGTITHSVVLRYQWKGATKVVKAYVAGIGRQDIILGHEWLQKENPVINWKSGQMKFNNHERWTRFEQNESLIRHDQHQEMIRKVADEPPSFDEFLRQCDEKEWASRPKKPMQELVNKPQKILRTTIEEVPNSEWDFSPDPPDEPTSSILDEPLEELPNHPPMNPHDDPPEQEEDYEARIWSMTNDLDPDEFLASYTPGVRRAPPIPAEPTRD
ncbi:hypothetical protein DAEQUDRAFT_764505 [Daedalea quercina L-15889]|uniref:Uncharacterized protein n=1 Tax=Daedalea quercina L-15889 TaxID=1314783 RepID=A0A165RE09_9APHY|nr:hypothetical protein DAEQUDRAFT_764505 [Daedalea quercina L-15889]